MNLKDEEIQALIIQLNEYNIQISLLTEKQQAAATVAKKCAQELGELREKYRITAQQLRKREVVKTSFYMWENIGDGG
ncbi:hypothetical protein [Crenothrix polyspora]|uniref:Uncharacterized protein n=1 Tax=Crenothrix polyspora TaxID=360316 RepID=A0A1R4HEY8_9GAMM|nr:hypothetical protein [Crenothrix polyspora]SJM94783.1 conserved hypothetical protein [Crenothrix polyspora]